MFEERPQQRLLAPSPTERATDGLAECSDVIRDVVGQVVVLGVLPDLLVGVEVRGVRGQPFDLDPARKPFKQSPGGRAMRWQPIDDQDDAVRQALKQTGHEVLEVVGPDVVVVDVEIKAQAPTPTR